jgi:glycosyltransferase involved in cell wall biosynthesis
MRVLLVSDAYPPLFGGATRAAQQLGRQLRLRGHDVSVATAWQRGLPALEDDGGVEVHRLRGLISRISGLSADPVRYTPPPFPDPELSWRLRRLIRRWQPDLVHSYGWLSYSCLPALWRTDVPLLFAAREYGNVCAVRTLVRQGRFSGSACSGPAWGKCLECAGAFYGQPKGTVAVASVLGQRGTLRRRTDAMHSVSRFCERTMRRYLLDGKTLPARVLPDFREDDIEGSPDPAILAQLPDEPFILFVGSFRRIKGDQLLVDAYRQLADPPPLVMIGARSVEPMPSLAGGITPLIDVPHATVMAVWDRALFGVCPSLVPEALGNTVHEGMSRGKAVIGTRPGGHEDMIENELNGLLVPSGDLEALTRALERLIADPAACDRMGEAARVRSEQFSADAVMPEIEAFFRVTAETPHTRTRRWSAQRQTPNAG